jgi:hypothetical protein
MVWSKKMDEKSRDRVDLDEGLNRLRKGGVNHPPPVDASPPPAPPPQKKPIIGVNIPPFICEDPILFAMTINHPSNEPIATLFPDGTVNVHKEGCEPETARILWNMVKFEGKSLYERIQELEKRIDSIRKTRIVLGYPPSPDSDFVEVENECGESIDAGTWSEENGLHVLTLDKL